jgi:hypothetical protein
MYVSIWSKIMESSDFFGSQYKIIVSLWRDKTEYRINELYSWFFFFSPSKLSFQISPILKGQT